MPTRLLVFGTAAMVCGCASVPAPAALQLANAGQTATAASQASLQGLATDVSQIAERQLVRTALIECKAKLALGGKGIICSPASLEDAGSAADAANVKLASVILLRVKAIEALKDAYRALADEANYNARAELEGAIGALDAQVNALTGALQSLGAPGLALQVIEPIVQKTAGESAARAQIRRLKAASKRLRLADTALVAAFKAEATLYGAIAQPVAANKAHVVDILIESGLVDPTATVAAFEGPLAVAPPKALATTDPMALVAARTIAGYSAQQAIAAAPETYAANEKALEALIDQHTKFEADQPMSLDRVVDAVNDLSGWVTTIQALKDTSRTAK